VGYRYYDKKAMDVLFPFGYGLSYTTFEYSNLRLSSENIKDTDTLTVTVDITNTGTVSGKEIVQLYVQDVESSVKRPVKELKGFEKVYLEPNETKSVTFILDKRSFAYYNTRIKDWHVETGIFNILIGKSSRDIVLSKSLTVESTVKIPKDYDMNTNYGDLLNDPNAKDFLKQLNDMYNSAMDGGDMGEGTEEMMAQMLKYNPLRAFVSFTDGKISYEFIQSNLDELNSR
jgi:beta-glucosidase